MTDLRKAAEMALEALEWNYGTDLENIENCTAWLDKMNATIPALRQALAESANSTTSVVEPVAWIEKHKDYLAVSADPFENAIPVYTAPPKKEWVGLTDADIAQTMHGSVEGSNMLPYQFARAIEAKLKEKNT